MVNMASAGPRRDKGVRMFLAVVPSLVPYGKCAPSPGIRGPGVD